MEIAYLKIVALSDIPRLDTAIANRVHHAIEGKLKTKPFLYGLPLRGKLHQYWKLRIGDYRVIYTVTHNRILVVCIGHRKEVYDLIAGRL